MSIVERPVYLPPYILFTQADLGGPDVGALLPHRLYHVRAFSFSTRPSDDYDTSRATLSSTPYLPAHGESHDALLFGVLQLLGGIPIVYGLLLSGSLMGIV